MLVQVNRSNRVPLLLLMSFDRKDCSLLIRPFCQKLDLKWGITHILECQEGVDQSTHLFSFSNDESTCYIDLDCHLTIRLPVQVTSEGNYLLFILTHPKGSSGCCCSFGRKQISSINTHRAVLRIQISWGFKHSVLSSRCQLPLGASWMLLHTFSCTQWGNSSMYRDKIENRFNFRIHKCIYSHNT